VGAAAATKAREVELKAEVMGAYAALVSTTRTNAELLELDTEIGTIEVGKRADLLLVDGDPLTNLARLQDHNFLSMILKDGRTIRR